MTHPLPTLEAIEELERLAKAATPGPWHAPKFIGQAQMFIYRSWGAQTQVARTLSTLKPDAAFIAAANPQTVLALLAAARAHLELKAAVVFDVRSTYIRRSIGMSDDEVFAKWLDGVKERGWSPTADSETEHGG